MGVACADSGAPAGGGGGTRGHTSHWGPEMVAHRQIRFGPGRYHLRFDGTRATPDQVWDGRALHVGDAVVCTGRRGHVRGVLIVPRGPREPSHKKGTIVAASAAIFKEGLLVSVSTSGKVLVACGTDALYLRSGGPPVTVNRSATW
jgi:hypothetical protein